LVGSAEVLPDAADGVFKWILSFAIKIFYGGLIVGGDGHVFFENETSSWRAAKWRVFMLIIPCVWVEVISVGLRDAGRVGNVFPILPLLLSLGGRFGMIGNMVEYCVYRR